MTLIVMNGPSSFDDNHRSLHLIKYNEFVVNNGYSRVLTIGLQLKSTSVTAIADVAAAAASAAAAATAVA